MHTKKIVANDCAEMMAELAAWLMQPVWAVGNPMAHKVVSLGWQGEGQKEINSIGSDSFVHEVKALLLS